MTSLGWTDTHREVQSSVRAFCQAELVPLVAEAEVTGTFPRARILPPMAALGCFRIGVPESHGGAGGDMLMQCIVAEEVARVCGGFAASVAPAVLGPSLLWQLGTPEQQQALLEPMMCGTSLPALGLTEPSGGSDVFNLRTTARRDGGAYILHGSKTFITNGPIADVVLIAAVLAEHAHRTGIARAAGLTLFLVPRATPGFSVARKLDKLGMRSSETGELHLDECRVPAAARLGGERVSFGQVLRVLDQNRLYVAALSVGVAAAAFEAALAYAKQRMAFGKPIGDQQTIAFTLARMGVDLDAARLLIARGAAVHDSGARSTAAAAAAKLFASEVAVRITGEALQIFGGYGYMTEFPVERYFRDAKVGTIWEGTSEIQQILLAQDLGLLRSGL